MVRYLRRSCAGEITEKSESRAPTQVLPSLVGNALKRPFSAQSTGPSIARGQIRFVMRGRYEARVIRDLLT